MLFSSVLNFALWATIIEFLGALLIVFSLFRASLVLLVQRNVVLARLLVAMEPFLASALSLRERCYERLNCRQSSKFFFLVFHAVTCLFLAHP